LEGGVKLMSGIDIDEVQGYLDRNYLTLEQLAERAGVAPERVLELVDAQCVPPHSHEVRGVAVFASTFGEYAAPVPPRRYYHPSLVDWVEKADALARQHRLADVARQMRTDFEQAFEDALEGRAPPWPKGVNHAWAYLMDGTWGLCLKEISAPNMLRKEYARSKIAHIAARVRDGRPSEGQRATLLDAIERYNEVATDFAPHERADSSRCREVEAVIEAYGLAAPPGELAGICRKAS
jgi:hypothetical protein